MTSSAGTSSHARPASPERKRVRWSDEAVHPDRTEVGRYLGRIGLRKLERLLFEQDLLDVDHLRRAPAPFLHMAPASDRAPGPRRCQAHDARGPARRGPEHRRGRARLGRVQPEPGADAVREARAERGGRRRLRAIDGRVDHVSAHLAAPCRKLARGSANNRSFTTYMRSGTSYRRLLPNAYAMPQAIHGCC